MKFIPVECPKCGGEFVVNEGTNKCYCQYCGAELLFDDGSIKVNIKYDGEHRTIIRDEARIKEAETELEKKRLEIENKESKTRVAIMKARVVAIIVCVLALSVAAWFYVDYRHIRYFLYVKGLNPDLVSSTTFIAPLTLGIALIIFLIATRNRKKK